MTRAVVSRVLACFSLALLLATTTACREQAPAVPPMATESDPLYFKPARFADLPGWQTDEVAAALPALAKSCARLLQRDPQSRVAPASGQGGAGGLAAAWQSACRALPAPDLAPDMNAEDTAGEPVVSDATARAFFETHFEVYELWGGDKRDGLFTGYYEPQLTAAPSSGDEIAAGTPLHARPADLITVDLGAFRPALAGESISGRVDGQRLVPYHTRAEIAQGALAGKAQELVRVTDATDAFFLQIQGSGQVLMPDGSQLRLGYDAQNGHPYFAIGRELIRRGVLTRENVSMQAIRDWLLQNQGEAQELMNLNPSYVFFRLLSEEGPLGAEGVALTAGRSLAVDRRLLPYGAPVFVDAEHPSTAGDSLRLQRLLIAQDTGGAIRGPVRGDVFWGAGDVAEDFAGRMKSRGRAWVLLPVGSDAVPYALQWRPAQRPGFFKRVFARFLPDRTDQTEKK